MKKLLALMLTAALTLSLAACGGGGSGENNASSAPSSSGEDSTSTEEPSEAQGLKIGDTCTGNIFEITLTDTEFGDKLNTDCTSENFMLPSEDGEGVIWVPEDGNIFLTFSFTYNFVGKEEYEDHFRSLGAPCVTYGEGYVFGDASRHGDTRFGVFAKETDDPSWHILTHSLNITLHRMLGFEENSKGSIIVDLTTEEGRIKGEPYVNDTYQPLDKSTYECRGFISVPLEVYENENEPLSIKFSQFPGDFIIR